MKTLDMLTCDTVLGAKISCAPDYIPTEKEANEYLNHLKENGKLNGPVPALPIRFLAKFLMNVLNECPPSGSAADSQFVPA